MLFCNCLHGHQLARTDSILCYYVVSLVIQPLQPGCPLVELLVVGNYLLERDGKVVIPLGTNICPPEGGRAWVECPLRSVLCVTLFHFCRRCRHAHSCWKLTFGKGWVGLKPSGQYHLHPGKRSGRGWSVLCATFSSFLSSLS